MKEITPVHLRCAIGTCMSVYVLENGTIVIIGQKPSPELRSVLQSRIGDDEEVVIMSPEYLAGIANTQD